MNNALTTTNGVAQLAHYGSRDEIRETVDRLMALHRDARKIGEPTMRAAAQLGLVLGANPFPHGGEMDIFLDKDGNPIVCLKQNFYRRKAVEYGGYLEMLKPRQMNDREREEWGIEKGDIATIIRIVKVDDMLRWKKEGFSAKEIDDMCSVVGIGIVTQFEISKRRYPPQGRSWVWLALKRCEKDALFKVFPLGVQIAQAQMKAGVSVSDEGEELTVSPEWNSETFEQNQPEQTIEGEFTPATIDDINAELFGYSPPARRVDAETGEIAEEPDGKYLDMLAWMESQPPTFGTVASAASQYGLFDTAGKALTALKTAPKVIENNVTVKENGRITPEAMVELFNWLKSANDLKNNHGI